MVNEIVPLNQTTSWTSNDNVKLAKQTRLFSSIAGRLSFLAKIHRIDYEKPLFPLRDCRAKVTREKAQNLPAAWKLDAHVVKRLSFVRVGFKTRLVSL